VKGVPAGASQTPYAKGVVVVWTIIPPHICRVCPRVSTNSLFSFIKLVPAGVRSPGVSTAYALCVWRVSCASAVVSSFHISRFRPIRCRFPPFDLPASSICLRFASAAPVSRPPSACCQDGIVLAPTSYCLTSIGVTTPSRFWRVVTFHASNPDNSRHAAVALSYRIYILVMLRLLFPSICRQDGVVFIPTSYYLTSIGVPNPLRF
jgi:hypothetical protein